MIGGNRMLKPGIKTSEFLAALLYVLGTLVASLTDKLDPKWAAIGSAIVVGLYGLARGLAKVPATPVLPATNVVPPPTVVTPPVAPPPPQP
jgi:EamA domain-containing membrane protein RarD